MRFVTFEVHTSGCRLVLSLMIFEILEGEIVIRDPCLTGELRIQLSLLILLRWQVGSILQRGHSTLHCPSMNQLPHRTYFIQIEALARETPSKCFFNRTGYATSSTLLWQCNVVEKALSNICMDCAPVSRLETSPEGEEHDTCTIGSQGGMSQAFMIPFCFIMSLYI